VIDLTRAVAIAAGRFHSCAQRADGGVYCWGDNSVGQLGDTTLIDHFTPNPVVGISATAGARQVSADAFYTCAVQENGGVRCWGDNAKGQLGDGTTVQQPQPALVPGLSGVAAVSTARFTRAPPDPTGHCGAGVTTSPDSLATDPQPISWRRCS
jgi:alpha-tubulin suppressor-like RCC1 family protein